VEDGRCDGLIVKLEVGENARDLDRMAEIRVAAGPGLRAMRLHREDVGAIDEPLVRIGIVGSNPLDQLITAQHFLKMGDPTLIVQARKDSGLCRVGNYSFANVCAYFDSSRGVQRIGPGQGQVHVDEFREQALQCPLPAAVELIGEKWAFLILRGAFNDLQHFEEFQAVSELPATSVGSSRQAG
jgi:hypothetical protein